MTVDIDDDEIFPDHYYEAGGVPVFKPTYDQFNDFYSFVKKIDHYGAKSGIVKVIPPKEWLDKAHPLPLDKLRNVCIKNAIKQTFMGQQGLYTQINQPLRRKTMGLKEWRDLSYSDDYRTPVISGFESDYVITSTPASSVKASRKRKAADGSESGNLAAETATDEAVSNNNDDIGAVDADGESIQPDFSYEDLMPMKDVTKSAAYYKELDRFYWKNVPFREAAYGADIEGSLFADDLQEWNVCNLESLLNKIKKKIPGVNTAYLYFGMYKSTFAWHLEDMDLYSINFIHFGAAKQWYVIPPEHQGRFERLARSLFPEAHKECPEFLRHKMFQISPTRIQDNNIPVYRCVQEEGEFIITFPYGYHAGYNVGYNCAESTNFALERWIDIGAKARSCQCVKHSVSIDVDTVFLGKVKSSTSSKVAAIPEIEERVCCLCGQSESADTTSRMLPVADSKVKRFCHSFCARAVPEVNLKLVEGRRHVVDFDKIPRMRKSLKCRFCDYKGGACIQCCKGKCVSAYHPMCAKLNGLICDIVRQIAAVQDETSDSVDVEEMSPVETKEFLCESYCPRHDPRAVVLRQNNATRTESVAKQIDSRKEDLGKKAVWIKWLDGEYRKGKLFQDFREHSMCFVMFPQDYVKAVAYHDIYFEDPVTLFNLHS